MERAICRSCWIASSFRMESASRSAASTCLRICRATPPATSPPTRRVTAYRLTLVCVTGAGEPSVGGRQPRYNAARI